MEDEEKLLNGPLLGQPQHNFKNGGNVPGLLANWGGH